MIDIWNVLVSGAVGTVCAAAYQSVYQKRWGQIAKLREVYANWAGSMFSLLMCQQAATDVVAANLAPASLLLALPENRALTDAIGTERKQVFRYEFELSMLETDQSYRDLVDDLTFRVAHWNYDAATDPELVSPPAFDVELELNALGRRLRARWSDWWALLDPPPQDPPPGAGQQR